MARDLEAEVLRTTCKWCDNLVRDEGLSQEEANQLEELLSERSGTTMRTEDEHCDK